MFPWGGELARVGPDDTPMAKRGARWVSHPFATWADPADDELNIAWVRAYRASNAPFTTGGVYLNFSPEGDERLLDGYGPEKYDRLVALKQKYDPANLFRVDRVGTHEIKVVDFGISKAAISGTFDNIDVSSADAPRAIDAACR